MPSKKRDYETRMPESPELQSKPFTQSEVSDKSVHPTHWVDEKGHEQLFNDNQSQEIIKRFGGGD
jgi:hypothetical protein